MDEEMITIWKAREISGIPYTSIMWGITKQELNAEIKNVYTIKNKRKHMIKRYKVNKAEFEEWAKHWEEKNYIERKLCGGRNTVSIGRLNDHAYDVVAEIATQHGMTINEYVRNLVWLEVKELL